MTQRSTLADYADLVTADVARVLSDMAGTLAQQSVSVLGGPLFASLARADQIAVQTVLGPLGAGGPWSAEVGQAWRRAVQAGMSTVDGAMAAQPADTAPATLRLTLKDEQEVEEEIEVSRLMQQLDAQAESTLRELRPLAAALRSDTTVRAEAVLLHPQAAAAGLGEAVRNLPLSAPARLACLHVLSVAAASPLADGYRRHLKALQARGVKPAQFRVRLGADARALPGAAASGVETPGHMAAVLGRLVEQASAEWTAEGPAGSQPGGAVQWPRELADRLMDQLLHTLGREAQVAPAMSRLFSQLTPAGQRLAAREPGLWQQHEHPWWQLLDRLMGLCAVLDDAPGAGQDSLVAACLPAVTGFIESDLPDTAACQQLLAEVDTLARRLAEGESPAGSADAAAEKAGVGESEPPLEQVLRDQMAQQLRQSQAPASLRRFLLGPWVQVLSQAMDPQAGDPQHALQCTRWVDGLLAVFARTQPATQAEADKLLAVAREGLQRIGLSEAQIESWLFDLTLRLSDARQAEAADWAEQGWRHDELPTVPIDLPSGGVRAARARRDREAWLRSLRVGDICRVFLDAQWLTLQLVSVDEAADVYGLQARGAAEPFRLTRAAVERLRAEGLATTVEPGDFIAKAMDTVVDALSSPKPPSVGNTPAE